MFPAGPTFHGRSRAAPDRATRRRVVSDEVAVVGSDDHLAPPNCCRRIDVRPSVTRPEQMSCALPEDIERSVRVPDEDPTVRESRRRVEVLPPVEEA